MDALEKVRRAGAAAVAAALALFVATLAAAEDRDVATRPRVTVTSKGAGCYRIEGSFPVDAPAEVAWAVLTDYDNLPSFVSSLRSSTASRDDSGRLLVSQEAVGRLGPFSQSLRVVLEVTADAPARLAFRDVGGASFHSYAGTWTIEPQARGVRVTYVLDARPRSSPPLFGRSVLAANARGLLDQVRREMLRRVGAALRRPPVSGAWARP